MRTRRILVGSFLILLAVCLVFATGADAQQGPPFWSMYVGNHWTYSASDGTGNSWTQRDEVFQRDTTTVPGVTTYLVNGYKDGALAAQGWYSISLTELKEWKEVVWEEVSEQWVTFAFDSGLLWARSPVTVGDQWTSTTSGSLTGATINISLDISLNSTVESYESVGLPLGTYKAYKLRHVLRAWNSSEGVDVTVTGYDWFIPYIGIVKQEVVDATGTQTQVLSSMSITKNIIDYDGDGETDILWQHADGAVAIWFMERAAIRSKGVPGAVDTDWQIKGAGDFNGDGKADILWQHADGAVAFWIMDGFTISSTGVPGAVGSDWQIKGVGDFDGDGKSDILWQHNPTGTVAVWLMNGTSISSVGIPGGVGTDWQVKGVGDFDRDRKSDILWQHTSGTVAIWLMDGATVSSVGVPGVVDSDWQIKGVGDFNGNGKADILWQHTSGAVAIWLMNGATISSTGVPEAVGSDWQIKGVGDFDGDGETDILWQHTSTGTAAMWLMNGATISSVEVSGAVTSDWQIKN